MEYSDFIQFVNDKNEFMRYNNIVLSSADMDFAEVTLKIGKHSLNPYGILHGGVYYTMQDCAAGSAARSNGKRYVTLNGNINYIKSISDGEIKAIATISHRGKTTCIVHTKVLDKNNNLLSDGTFTMFCIDNSSKIQK